MLFSACVSEGGQVPERGVETGETAGAEPVYEIIDYKTRAGGDPVPEWVSSYLEGETAAIESLEEYQDRYVFVARNRGSNFKALEQWNLGFVPELDFARLAAVRIERRFTQAAGGFPDSAYGSYFESLIRAASDADWKGVVREDDFWLKHFIPASGENENSGESYDFIILVTIDKTLLASQIQVLLNGIKPQPPPTRDQTSAASRVRDRFFEGF
jgi:hypothetical protein